MCCVINTVMLTALAILYHHNIHKIPPLSLIGFIQSIVHFVTKTVLSLITDLDIRFGRSLCDSMKIWGNETIYENVTLDYQKLTLVQ